MIYVIGSGPSGVAAASAVLDEGRPVTMLDVGETMDSAALERAEKLRASLVAGAAADVRAVAPDELSVSPDWPRKRVFGSTFPYALDAMAGDSQHDTRCVQSFARGGLSTVWGAAVLPSEPDELDSWPRAARDLDANYAAVARFMPVAAVDDELAVRFPLHAPPLPPLRPSQQAAHLLQRWREGRAELDAARIAFGQSRLAVRSTATPDGAGCEYLGRCLSGCPQFAIWSSADTLRTLQRRSGFTYRAGVRVDALEPGTSAAVVIHARSATGEHDRFDAARVLVACGPVSTARLVLHSLRAYDTPRTLVFQPYFLLPMLATRSVPAVERERLHTLAQLFVEIDDAAVSRHTVHLQVYTYNPFIGARVERIARVFGPASGPVRRYWTGRLLAVQGYAHSREAEGIAVRARADGSPDGATLELRGPNVPPPVIARTVQKLSRLRRVMGMSPLRPLLEIGVAGDGNHAGGTFPMREAPADLDTDVTGQLARLPGVHIVDSSVLPSLPATTFTYTVMANADRIARAVARSLPA